MTTITAHYAGFLALFYIVLSLRVLALRGNPAFRFLAFGRDDAGQVLARAARGHGNFAEYTPIFLILLYLSESGGADPSLLYGCAGGFTLGRLMHGVLFAFMTHNMALRVGGMVLTLVPIGVLAIWLMAMI